MTLADTSVWIDSFHGGDSKDIMNLLIANEELCINDVVLAELLPSINQRGEKELQELLLAVPRLPLAIDWNEIVNMQTENLRHGINKVGLPDLLIAQNAIQQNVRIFSCDKHFSLMGGVLNLPLYAIPEKS